MHTFDRDPDAGPFFGPRKEIQGLPTLVFYRSGYAISKQEGYQNPATIETWVPWQNSKSNVVESPCFGSSEHTQWSDERHTAAKATQSCPQKPELATNQALQAIGTRVAYNILMHRI